MAAIACWALFAAVAATATCVVFGAVDKDLVTSLPGYPGTLPTRHWSGYIPSQHEGNLVKTHYWLVENSAKNPDAPTVIWFNGGPGSSSLIGLFTENGPLTLNDFSSAGNNDTLRVFDNPYSWHTAPANVVYFEHPAPAGFSMCTPGPCYWTDETQAVTNYAVLKAFFSDDYFPELANNRLLITGESYAGVLVPTLLDNILKERTLENKHKAPWSVEGFALGNDCPGNRVFTCTPYSGWIGTQVALEFRFRHGMISEDLYAQINRVCEGEWGTYAGPTSKKCRELLEDPIRPVKSEAGDTYGMGGGYFLYDTCGSDLMALDPETHQPVGHSRTLQGLTISNGTAPVPEIPNSGQYYCGQERMSLQYLNQKEVQEALHVEIQPFSFSTGLHYNFTAHSLISLYNDTLIHNGLRIVQYSGDADPCVPYIGTERWIKSLNMKTTSKWRPWVVDSQVAGYVTGFHNESFHFVTVRDAGHMVPRYKPKAALHLLKWFVYDQKL